jgi:hypothetical protein
VFEQKQKEQAAASFPLKLPPKTLQLRRRKVILGLLLSTPTRQNGSVYSGKLPQILLKVD